MSDAVGAVVLRAGSRYVTLGTVPEAASLSIQRVEKIPVAALASSFEVGDTVAFPLDVHGGDSLYQESYPEEEARAYLERFVERNSFQELRSNAARQGLDTGQNPFTEDIIDAYVENHVHVGEIDPNQEEPVSYTLMDLVQGIEEADGPAADEALDILDAQASKLEKKMQVAEDYRAIQDPNSPLENVEDVADKHGVHWRTVHRYVDAVGVERLTQA